jgi:hypothetical protein
MRSIILIFIFSFCVIQAAQQEAVVDERGRIFGGKNNINFAKQQISTVVLKGCLCNTKIKDESKTTKK